MGAYTIKNLKADVEDMAPRFGMAPGMEARFARRPLGCEQLGLSYERLAPNFRAPFGHTHGRQEEVYVLLSGSARAKVGDEIVELKQWDALRVAPGTMRQFEAGADGAEVLAVGAPATGEDDSELVTGWWSD
jgi:mannose-6-phosphate isomerase-like protein (cupin superfamily)